MPALMINLAVVAVNAIAAPKSIWGPPPNAINPAQGCISDICGPPARLISFPVKYQDVVLKLMRSKPGELPGLPPAVAEQVAAVRSETERQNALIAATLEGSAPEESTPLGSVASNLYQRQFSKPPPNAPPPAGDGRSAEQPPALNSEDIQTLPPELLLRHLHPKLSARDALVAEVKRARDYSSLFLPRPPLERSILFDTVSPDQIAQLTRRAVDGTIDETETRQLLRWNGEAQSLKTSFIDPQTETPRASRLTTRDLLASVGGTDGVRRTARLRRQTDQFELATNLDQCHVRYLTNKALLPTPAQVTNLKGDFERGKQKVADVIRAKFPPSMQKDLIAAIERVEPILPPSAQDFESSYVKSLRQRAATIRESTSNLKAASADERWQAVALSASLKNRSLSTPRNDYCDAYRYGPGTDANFVDIDRIDLSFTAATTDELTRMKTITHEIGHSVSRAIAANPKYLAMMSGVSKCLADQHTEPLPPQTAAAVEVARAADPHSPGPYLEEDLSDAIAKSADKDHRGNPWCQHLHLTPDRQAYEESSLQADDGDNHSSTLFRLLSFESTKTGRLPDSCRTFMAKNNFEDKFASCLDRLDPYGGDPPEPAKAAH